MSVERRSEATTYEAHIMILRKPRHHAEGAAPLPPRYAIRLGEKVADGVNVCKEVARADHDALGVAG